MLALPDSELKAIAAKVLSSLAKCVAWHDAGAGVDHPARPLVERAWRRESCSIRRRILVVRFLPPYILERSTWTRAAGAEKLLRDDGKKLGAGLFPTPFQKRRGDVSR